MPDPTVHFFHQTGFDDVSGRRLPRFASHLDPNVVGRQIVNRNGKDYLLLEPDPPGSFCGGQFAYYDPIEHRFRSDVLPLITEWPNCPVFPQGLAGEHDARPPLVAEIAGIQPLPNCPVDLSQVNGKRFRLDWTPGLVRGITNAWSYDPDVPVGDRTVRINFNSRGNISRWPAFAGACTVQIWLPDAYGGGDWYSVLWYGSDGSKLAASGFLPVHLPNQWQAADDPFLQGTYGGIMSVYPHESEPCPSWPYNYGCGPEFSGWDQPPEITVDFVGGPIAGAFCDVDVSDGLSFSQLHQIALGEGPVTMPRVMGTHSAHAPTSTWTSQVVYGKSVILGSWYDDSCRPVIAVADYTLQRSLGAAAGSVHFCMRVAVTVHRIAEGTTPRRHPIAWTVPVVADSTYSGANCWFPFPHNLVDVETDYEGGGAACWDCSEVVLDLPP